MIEKLKSLIWFLKNPKYFSQIFQLLKRSQNAELENSSGESLSWCKENQIDQSEALVKLFGENKYESLNEVFPKEIESAKKEEAKSPFAMGGEGAISFLYHVVENLKPRHVLETGVAYGWSSLAILLALEKNKDGRLISNDMPYIKMNNEDYVGCVVPIRLQKLWTLQRNADKDGIPKAIKVYQGQLDLVHYDSDKSYCGRTWASPILWQALRPGGIFISDDINDNLAFKHFGEKMGKTPLIVKHKGKYVGLIVK